MNDDTTSTEQASSSGQSNSRRTREPYFSWREENGRPLSANRQTLARTAAETRALLPDILRQLPSIRAGAKIHISDGDSWNVAIELMNQYQGNPAGNGRAMADRVALALPELAAPLLPVETPDGVYTPDVVVIRGDHANGHVLLLDDPTVQPADLPVFSVLSVAAINRPATKMGVPPAAGAGGQTNRRRQLLFADTETRS
ncbi:unnamed protein product [Parascedosporium putredinis]|uniref:Uncharacterized protein n=1 Tax=Parascedosporium putredinis TaxID=1442378 RepID=A0A9P1H8F7_9PEZI|nr:unnamed protein product [Parascedosporium putredinis]CAI7999330.1 unnamed protein product [Parascedosporium putredinis]